jgi:hypothetical protein
MMRRSVHDIPIDELAAMVSSEPQEDECTVCGASCSTDDDLEPTAACNPCAQTAAVRLAEHVSELRSQVVHLERNVADLEAMTVEQRAGR